ncbi:MAG: DNA methyltransferase [Phycisphaerales bacterium JB054]
MSDKFNDLVRLLRELFQLDQPDLDFGLYRIMHAKSGEVTQFLEKDLLPQVKKAFEQYQPADKAAIKKKLDQAVAAAESLGVDPDTNEKVLELRAALAEGADLEALENEVYDHLYSFFRRYYSEGDFLAKRVYKPGVYAVPYEGEEVVLHWANKDQYYIKTSEYLRDYAFRLKPDAGDAGGDPMRVHFRLAAAAEGEHGVNKAAEGKDRVFILAPAGESGHDFLSVETVDGREELVIGFEYRPATMDDWTEETKAQATAAAKKKPPKQKDLSDIAVKSVLATTGTPFDGWIAELAKPHTKVNGETAEYSRLEGHLSRYCARHTFDYFIHKDLDGFLRRELDFYIKNEVLHLDDVQDEDAPKVEQYLSKIKVIRTIAGKVIDFLSQLEEFQRALWLKKKFVIESSYRITLDLVPEDLYPEIAACTKQIDEWNDLFGIREWTDFTEPLSKSFLAEHQMLPVNTALLDAATAEAALDAVQDRDESTTGVVVHGDNFHALRLLGSRYADQVQCIYIDPPYNTDVSAIPYKNNYRHSSFASLIHDRTSLMRPLLAQEGVMFVSIDKTERTVVEHAMDHAFGRQNRVGELIWIQNTNDGRSPTYSTNHEYVQVYARSKAAAEANPRIFREPKPGYIEVSELIAKLQPEYPLISVIQDELRSLYRQHKRAYRREVEAQGLKWEIEKRNDPWKGIYQYKFAEYRGPDGKLVSEENAKQAGAHIWVFRESDWTIMSSEDKQSDSISDPEHPNYRFYQPFHPITQKPCAMPSRGWKGTQFRDPKYPDRNSWESLVEEDRIAFGPDETKVPQQKRFLRDVQTNVCKTVFNDYSDGEKETTAMFGRPGLFLAPKHSRFVQRFIRQVVGTGSLVLDCFGGSGSTAQAVISTNREEEMGLKFLLVEVNTYFDRVLVPRILKSLYASDWGGGKPKSKDHLSACVHVLRIESYEDALNNIVLDASGENRLFGSSADRGKFAEDYMLRYLLPTESRDSPSLVNVAGFADPTKYTLRVKVPGADESRSLPVDLVETFNLLLGMRVSHVAAPKAFRAEFARDSERRLAVKGRIKEDPDGPWWFRTVTGTTPDGKRALIIWRKRPGGDEPEGIEQDNAVLDAWFDTLGYSTTDSELDIVWVNGDNNLANRRQAEASEDGLGETGWKVRIIEQDFHRLMFDTSDVPGGA